MSSEIYTIGLIMVPAIQIQFDKFGITYFQNNL